MTRIEGSHLNLYFLVFIEKERAFLFFLLLKNWGLRYEIKWIDDGN